MDVSPRLELFVRPLTLNHYAPFTPDIATEKSERGNNAQPLRQAHLVILSPVFDNLTAVRLVTNSKTAHDIVHYTFEQKHV